MSWINEVDINEADEKLKPIYDDLIKSRGKISNILKVHSLNPEASFRFIHGHHVRQVRPVKKRKRVYCSCCF